MFFPWYENESLFQITNQNYTNYKIISFNLSPACKQAPGEDGKKISASAKQAACSQANPSLLRNTMLL